MLSRKHRLPLRSKLYRLERTGKRFHTPSATLLISQQNPPSLSRFAFVVSRRLDKRATRRNRTKRLLSQAIQQLLPEIKPGLDVVVYARKIIMTERVEDVLSEIRSLLEKS